MKKTVTVLLSSILSFAFIFSGCSDKKETQTDVNASAEKTKVSYVINSEKEHPINTIQKMVLQIDDNKTKEDFEESVAAFYILNNGNSDAFFKLDGNNTDSIVAMKDKLISEVQSKYDNLLNEYNNFNKVAIEDFDYTFTRDSLDRKRGVTHILLKNNSPEDIFVVKIYVVIYDTETGKALDEDIVRVRIKEGLKHGEEGEYFVVSKSSSPLSTVLTDSKWDQYVYSYVLKLYGGKTLMIPIEEGSYDGINGLMKEIVNLRLLDNIVSKKLDRHILTTKFKQTFDPSTFNDEAYIPEE